MPLPQSSIAACLYWNIGVVSCTGSFAMSLVLMAEFMSSIASMPGASSQPQVAARQLLKHCSRFCRPVLKLLIFTGWTFTDHGIAASSASLGPGSTREAVCANTCAWLMVFFTQPRAHGLLSV